MEERRKIILREMEGELATTEQQCIKFENRVSSTMRIVEQLKSGTIHHLY